MSRMSAMGQKRTPLSPIALVRFVPIAEIVIAYLSIVTNRQARTRTGPVEG